MKPYLKIEEP
jgi:hypothetical protein